MIHRARINRASDIWRTPEPHGRKSRDGGFVLISALWLLILGGAAAALLMLRATDAAQDARATSESAAALDIPDDAIATIAGDILFSGPNSAWSRLPSAGPITIDGHVLAAALRREDSLPDVNKSDIATLDDSLHEQGYDARQRNMILSRIAGIRATRGQIATFADIAALARDAVPPGQENCLADILSPFGGTGTLVQGAAASFQDMGAFVRLGDVVRLTISGLGPSRSYAVRITNLADQPYSVLDWQDETCAHRSVATA